MSEALDDLQDLDDLNIDLDRELGINTETVFWGDTKVRITQGTIVPIIGNSISIDHILGERHQDAIQQWAKLIGYPYKTSTHTTRVAQFAQMLDSASAARHTYLKLLKLNLLKRASEGDVSRRTLKKVYDQRDQLTFTQIAEELGYLNFEEIPEHPLSILAALPLPVYITTSHHQFLEVALTRFGRKPHSLLYPWREDLKTSVAQTSHQASDTEPLVYHLYGRDDLANSLVLTENDYLDFLVQIAQDRSRNLVAGVEAGLPSRVEEALTQHSLMLLGFSLEEWDFRVLFRSLLASQSRAPDSDGLSTQVQTDLDEAASKIKASIKDYFLRSRFIIFDGNPSACMAELQHIWEGYRA